MWRWHEDRKALADMAAMCVALRMSPAEYWALTHEETVALVDQINKERKGR